MAEFRGLLERISEIRKSVPELTPIVEMDQSSLTINSLTQKIHVILNESHIQNKRILALGDFDMTGSILSLVGKPKDTVITDIDTRLAEILFELQMSYDAPVRFVYHDMRKKLIEVLSNQFDLIIAEPPPTKQGMELFLSRAINAAKENHNHDSKDQASIVFLTLPDDHSLFEHLKIIANKAYFTIENKWKIIEYGKSQEKGHLFKLRLGDDSTPVIIDHYLGPLYSFETTLDPQPWTCQCGNTVLVGKEGQVASLSLLYAQGCPNCRQRDVFKFASKVPIK